MAWTPRLAKRGPQANPNDPYTPTKGNLASLASGKGPYTPRTPLGAFQEPGLRHRYHIQVCCCCVHTVADKAGWV